MPARRSRPGVAGALALLGALAMLAACTTTVDAPKPARDSPEARAPASERDSREPRRDNRNIAEESRQADSIAGAPRAESDARRRAAIRLELAAGFYQQGNYQQSLEEIRQALSIDPGYAQAFGLLGLVYMDLGERSRAEEGFQRALRLAPDDSEILNNYGWFLCQTDRPKESIPQFMAALKNPLYPTPSRPLHNAGICSRRAGDDAAAESYFLRSFQLDPKNPVAMYNLAELSLKRGNVERARFYSQRLTTLYAPSAETLWLAIRVDRKAGDRDSVASLSSQLRRQFPASQEANLLQRGAFGD